MGSKSPPTTADRWCSVGKIELAEKLSRCAILGRPVRLLIELAAGATGLVLPGEENRYARRL